MICLAVKKCPICEGTILNGACKDCGFPVPDEAEISSMYNYDPDDDEFGEKDEYIPAPEMNDGMPEIKVREEVDRNFRNPYDYKRTPDIQTVQKNNVQIQPQQNNANPYVNFSPVNNHQQGNGRNVFNNNSGSSNADPLFVKDLVIGIVLAMVTGIIGFFYGARFIRKYNTTRDNKYLYAGIAILILSFLGLIF